MKRINLSRYFTRKKELDFTDDGSRFAVYDFVDYMRITKCCRGEKVFISAYPINNKLPYEQLKKVMGFEVLERLNGVQKDDITGITLNRWFLGLVNFVHYYHIAVKEYEASKED